MSESRYIGRFAPSPSGDLHFGSIITALAGYLEARSRGGLWYLRIDDLDPPRNVAGSADAICRALERLGLNWDGSIMFQSRRGDAYAAAFATLEARGLIYPCYCSRRALAGRPHPSRCPAPSGEGGNRPAWRLHVGSTTVTLTDRIQGPLHWTLATTSGDFVVWRVESIAAYHLAAVVDDAALGITDVIRGADLLEAAPAQRHLQTLLDVPAPTYAHLPVALSAHGQKLSKQNHAPDVAEHSPAAILAAALAWLGQPSTLADEGAPAEEILAEARTRWSLAAVPAVSQQAAPRGFG